MIQKSRKLDRRGVPKVIREPRDKPPFNFECISENPGVHPHVKTHSDFDLGKVFAAFGEGPDGSDMTSTTIAI